MNDKVMAALGVVVGGAAVILELLVAFGVNLSADQQTAIASAAGLVLAALGSYFHPSIPVGKK